MQPIDTIKFFAEKNSLGFVESTSRRWEIKPELKPNHETFSVESQYSTADNPGGTWEGKHFIAPPGKGRFMIPTK